MFISHRRSTPKVRDGKVQRKNRWSPTPNCYNTAQPTPVIDRERPGWGYRHLVRKCDLERFIAIIPDWNQLSIGINVLILARGNERCFGWHRPGLVALCAWDREIILTTAGDGFYREHQRLLENLGVPCVRCGQDWELRFTENTARAFQLVHVFLHEIGHHRDRWTTRSKRNCSRGEGYAEEFARLYESTILSRYRDEFPL